MTRTAAIIGGGVIGGGWAARFLLNGWDVNIYDPDPNAEHKIAGVLDNARYALPMLYDVALPATGRLTYCDTLAQAVITADWIQESVPERLTLKTDVFQLVQEHCSPDAVIGSSTSGFKPTQLQENAQRPGQIIVAHPFNPVYLLPLVELVPSARNPAELIDKASDILSGLGMYPLHIGREIDAHIADRLLEAIWREALWLVRDDIATTEEIDNAIRYGFGLRWAQMGLFETYRIAGGEAGMRHFISQFGPALKWPWSKLTDVPELTDDLITKIAEQSDAQSGAFTIRQLERQRDENLVGILRALKARDAGAGALLKQYETALTPAITTASATLTTQNRTIPIDWTDHNGHMNESRYGQVFSDAADAVLTLIGADADYIAAGHGFFTVEIDIRFLRECHAGHQISVASKIIETAGKKLKIFHEMKSTDGTVLATGDQLLLHVSLTTRRACEPDVAMQLKMRALMQS